MFLVSHAALIVICIVASFHVVAQANDDLRWVPFDRQQFNGSVALDTNADVQLYWKIGEEYSTFGIASRSSGYLAVGFSQTGAMTGADIAVGYTDQDGVFSFENRHASGFVTPEISQDQEGNMRFKEGYQADGVTAFIFEKNNKADCLETQADVAVTSWQWMIYAFSQDNSFSQHGPGENGKKYVRLGNGKVISTLDTPAMPGTRNWTITQPEVMIPTAETTYCYSLHKVPVANKNFLLAERPTQSSPLLHHLVVYACYGMPQGLEEMEGKQPNCEWETFSNPCSGFVTEWAPGMSGRTFEPGYGKPFGSELYEYVMFETHYNNPEGLEGEKDAASYTFLYNDIPVETEIGTLTLGDLQVTGWFLEPGKELVPHSTVCTPECTRKWPSDGITAVSVFHHMHYRGRNAKVQIIRNGTEISSLSSLRDFEYGYQFSKSLDEIKLLPGDKFITTCEYDTSKDTEPVPGGLSSQEEMCFAWVDYYPANDVLACTQFDLGSAAENQINGTVAVCMESTAEAPDVFPSAYLNSTFESLPVTGDNCPAASSPESNAPGSSDEAAVLSTCPETEVCFSIHIPRESASSGSGDIYLQLSAPTTYSWVALAQGTTMTNANMFLMYSSADGTNVTLSPRNAPEHSMPTRNDAANVSLLEGSGISDGRMTANFRCSNCHEWSSGDMSFSSGSSDWLYAYRQGPSIVSDDTNAAISIHDRHGVFQWDLSRATGGSKLNPFTGAAGNTTSNSPASVSGWERLSATVQRRFVQAHGALAAVVFVAIFPTGALLVRLASFSGLAWAHGALQIFGYTVFVAAAGLGIFMASSSDRLQEPHAIIGMVLLAVFFFMPFVGVVHHKVFVKVHKRTWWSYSHIFVGRFGVLLGMINGGLGLQLADAGRSPMIAYGVLGGLMGIVYCGVVFFGEIRRGKTLPRNVATVSKPKQLAPDDSDRAASPERRLP